MPAFQGVVPSLLATCSSDGTPNVTYLSHVYYVDSRHVALSCQFFNKTRRNVEQNPYATVQVHDPLTLAAHRLLLRYDHSQTEGPLFDQMAMRIQAIASHTGMTEVFRLIAADVYEVLEIEDQGSFLTDDSELDDQPVPSIGTYKTELRGLQVISDRINRARDLDDLLSSTLLTIDEFFGFKYSMILFPDETGQRLFTIASHGYGESGVGAEVQLGQGLLGAVAKERRALRVTRLDADLRYGRAVRGEIERMGGERGLHPELPLPGLPDAQSELALPLVLRDKLIGVLAVESRDPYCFREWHEAYLNVIGNQIAIGIDRMLARTEGDDEHEGARGKRAAAVVASPGPAAAALGQRSRSFCYYKNDDCVFVDGEYLIRNVPGKILWKLLTSYERERRTQFSNRELRLDPELGLPAVKDNLESRLILLRRRLEQKCPDVRLVSTSRGRFALELDCNLELVEKASG